MTFDLKVVSMFNAYQRIYLSGFALIDFTMQIIQQRVKKV